ncbi:hypothetical protein A9Q86_12940 [Flavobacteriales bacterium 33_180_T64]|nr:hypothetical protein A9Q86_12940 [Flavobacteriales bacterium 33_180_T64]
MNVFILPFGKISILESNIAEIVINDGVIMDEEKIIISQELIKTHLQIPFSFLVNKEHTYSYTFEAQLAMGNLKGILSIAAVIKHQRAEIATKIIRDVNRHENWNIKFFRERTAALDWLQSTQNNKRTL